MTKVVCTKEDKKINMRIYLDNCCYNRPYDDQSHILIYLETQRKRRHMLIVTHIQGEDRFCSDSEKEKL